MNLAWSEIQSSDFNMEIASGYHEYAGIRNMLLMIEPASLKAALDVDWDDAAQQPPLRCSGSSARTTRYRRG